MNVEIRTEAAQFPEKEYIYGIFVAVFPPTRLVAPCFPLCFAWWTPTTPKHLSETFNQLTADSASPLVVISCHRVHTVWQWPFSGVHSIMMEKLAQPGAGEGCTPTSLHISTIMYKVLVYSPAEREDTLPLFLLHPYMYSVSATYTDVVDDTIYKYSTYKLSLCTVYKIMTDIFPLFLTPPCRRPLRLSVTWSISIPFPSPYRMTLCHLEFTNYQRQN
jgi:hypothetical protein